MGNSIAHIVAVAIETHRNTSGDSGPLGALMGDHTYSLLEKELRSVATVAPSNDPILSIYGTPVYPLEAPGTTGIIIGELEVIQRMRKAFLTQREW